MPDKNQDPEYILANVGSELERLRKQNRWLQKCYNGKLIFAPVDLKKDNLKVLDMGCADGMFFRQIQGLLTPSAQLVGLDLMPSFLEVARAEPTEYPNTRYAIHNICDPLPSDLQSTFEFTHVRNVLAASGPVGVKSVVEYLVSSLAPGGWLQIQEMDTSPDSTGGSSTIRDFLTVLRRLIAMVGQDVEYSHQLEGFFRDAGLENVSVQRLKATVGRKLGNDADIAESIEPFKLTIPAIIQATATLDIPQSVTQDLEQRFDKEMKEVGGHFNMIVVIGQKRLA